jgi:predicted TIM-barrel fold metal-dependent hydrolase
LPAHLWRLTKFWRGMRAEIPWVSEPPWEIARRHIRLSTQPLDLPDGTGEAAATLERIIEHLRSDEMLLFATDYPHWQYDGLAALPEGLSQDLIRKMMADNPRATYARL